jgi:hypothetical protein
MSKIAKSFVRVQVETDTGYESNEEWGPNHGSMQLKLALIEIVRLLTINGEGSKAIQMAKMTHNSVLVELESEEDHGDEE